MWDKVFVNDIRHLFLKRQMFYIIILRISNSHPKVDQEKLCTVDGIVAWTVVSHMVSKFDSPLS